MSPSNSPRLRSRGHSRPSDECRLPTLRTRSQERVLFAEPEVRSEARSRGPGGAFHGWLPERVPCSQGNHAIWASYAHSTNGLSASRYWLNASNDGTACNVMETCPASPPADLWWTISIFNPGKRAMAGLCRKLSDLDRQFTASAFARICILGARTRLGTRSPAQVPARMPATAINEGSANVESPVRPCPIVQP
jgi:hypothetical protein